MSNLYFGFFRNYKAGQLNFDTAFLNWADKANKIQGIFFLWSPEWIRLLFVAFRCPSTQLERKGGTHEVKNPPNKCPVSSQCTPCPMKPRPLQSNRFSWSCAFDDRNDLGGGDWTEEKGKWPRSQQPTSNLIHARRTLNFRVIPTETNKEIVIILVKEINLSAPQSISTFRPFLTREAASFRSVSEFCVAATEILSWVLLVWQCVWLYTIE